MEKLNFTSNSKKQKSSQEVDNFLFILQKQFSKKCFHHSLYLVFLYLETSLISHFTAIKLELGTIKVLNNLEHYIDTIIPIYFRQILFNIYLQTYSMHKKDNDKKVTHLINSKNGSA